MQLDVVNNENEKIGSIDLSDTVFGGKVKTDLIWEAVVHANAAKRPCRLILPCAMLVRMRSTFAPSSCSIARRICTLLAFGAT